MTMEQLKFTQMVIEGIVQLAYVGLMAYAAKLVFKFLIHRLDILGKDARVFVPVGETPGWTITETTSTTTGVNPNPHEAMAPYADDPEPAVECQTRKPRNPAK